MTSGGDRCKRGADPRGYIAIDDEIGRLTQEKLRHCKDTWEEGIILHEDLAERLLLDDAEKSGAHKRRSKHLVGAIADFDDKFAKSVEIVARRVASTLRQSAGDHVTLKRKDVEALLTAIETGSLRLPIPRAKGSGRGRPPILRHYRSWMAIHFMWLRSQGASIAAAERSVMRSWCITRTAVQEARKALQVDRKLVEYSKKMLAMAAARDLRFLPELYDTMCNYLLTGRRDDPADILGAS